jgi:hypothetical protein
MIIPKSNVFKDQNGRIVIWQWPNVPLFAWLALKTIAMLSNDPQRAASFSNLSTAFLFTWAFLELTQGVTVFRKLLGLVVIGGAGGSLF